VQEGGFGSPAHRRSAAERAAFRATAVDVRHAFAEVFGGGAVGGAPLEKLQERLPEFSELLLVVHGDAALLPWKWQRRID
jgi:hypothetical protein